MIKGIRAKIKELCSAARTSAEEQQLIKKLEQFAPQVKSSRRALVQMVNDPAFILRFIFFLGAWKNINGQSLSYDGNWSALSYRFSMKTFVHYFVNTIVLDFLYKRKWTKIFAAFGVRRVYPFAACGERVYVDLALQIQRQLTAPKDVLGIQDSNLEIGDLIYDTYLRYRNVATLDIEDPALVEIIAKALKLCAEYREMFNQGNYEFYLTSYTSYIQHGIPVRIALQQGVPVYAMGAYNQLVLKPTYEFPYHRRAFHRYKEWLQDMPSEEREEGVAWAHENIQRRFMGKVDQATWYMKKSAYQESNGCEAKVLPAKTSRTIVIMAHDFFDSPHIYGSMVYPDFYIWLERTLDFLSHQDVEVLLKPHPNALEQNTEVIDGFRVRYPKAIFLQSSVNIQSLAIRGIDLLITVYGTVAHEGPYLGIPCISVGMNPHKHFQFTPTVLGQNEYFEYLSFQKRPLQASIDDTKDSVAEFFLVHNYRVWKKDLSLFSLVFSMSDLICALEVNGTEFASRFELAIQELKDVDQI